MNNSALSFRILTCFVVACFASDVYAAELPSGSAPNALEFSHFPDRMHVFIWRNWMVVEPARMAKVLNTSVENIEAVAASMGLPPAIKIPSEQEARGYITTIRRNWHLLPYDQLLVLLNMSAEQLAYTLREDDFLFIKLGSLKPSCEPLCYVEPSADARTRTAAIKSLVLDMFGDELQKPGEARFAFIKELNERLPASQRSPGQLKNAEGLRFIYSYCALYGDPLSNPDLDPYPDGLLERLANLGVNGVWMHVVLNQLAPSKKFPEFGAGYKARLAGLRRLVKKAGKYNIKIYLYMNEPRAMQEPFFKNRIGMQGVQEKDHFAMCTSSPEVREWISDSLAYVFKKVPGLGGVFTITASENLTSCASHGKHKACQRCGSRSAAEIIAEVNNTIEAGVHRGNPDAKVIAWDWAWGEWAGDAISKLSKSIWYMSVSEWSKPIERGGVKTAVGEYSISAVGPGPRALKNWELAKQAGLKTAAKVQFNNTWELSSVPYLPVLDLIAEHCVNLASAGVDGQLLSWSLGGYPSPNLEVARYFSEKPVPSAETVLDAVARSRFGDGAADARKAWTAFSKAFQEYPYHISVLYNGPQQYGPANLLFAEPTGFRATMVGIPYDDLKTWRGPYPADVFGRQFAKVADGWKKGLADLQHAVAKAPKDCVVRAQAELNFAEAAQLHFQSVASQVRFVMARDELLNKAKPLTAEEKKARLDEISRLVEDEIQAARRLFTLTRQDSRIGFEASNHYYYMPLDLVEKVVNCRHVLERLRQEAGKNNENSK